MCLGRVGRFRDVILVLCVLFRDALYCVGEFYLCSPIQPLDNGQISQFWEFSQLRYNTPYKSVYILFKSKRLPCMFIITKKNLYIYFLPNIVLYDLVWKISYSPALTKYLREWKFSNIKICITYFYYMNMFHDVFIKACLFMYWDDIKLTISQKLKIGKFIFHSF